MRTLELPAGKSPREWGRIHGESFRGEIKALAAIRVYLCTKVGGFKSSEQVTRPRRRAHLPVLERYHRGALRRAARHRRGRGVSRPRKSSSRTTTPICATSIRSDDLAPGADARRSGRRRRRGAASLGGDGCTCSGPRRRPGAILAQTWDMHATAIPYVMVLGVPESADGPAATLLTVTGCLGMAGMNAARVAIAINNLYSTDATLGVVWPAIVRRALHERSAAAARDRDRGEPDRLGPSLLRRGSPRGRVRDRGVGHPAQAGVRRRRLRTATPTTASTVNRRAQHRARTSTTYERMRGSSATSRGRRSSDLDDVGIVSAPRMAGRTASVPTWRRPMRRTRAATCGAIAMNVDTGELWAQQGMTHNVAPQKWRL